MAAGSLFLRTALLALIKSKTPIRKVYFNKNAFEALTIDSWSGIFDLACTDENGTQFIVDMQSGLLLSQNTLWPDGGNRVVLSGRLMNQR